jgi:hypothetical protein
VSRPKGLLLRDSDQLCRGTPILSYRCCCCHDHRRSLAVGSHPGTAATPGCIDLSPKPTSGHSLVQRWELSWEPHSSGTRAELGAELGPVLEHHWHFEQNSCRSQIGTGSSIRSSTRSASRGGTETSWGAALGDELGALGRRARPALGPALGPAPWHSAQYSETHLYAWHFKKSSLS